MAPRVTLPPKKNRARCGIKFPLKIFKGDLRADSHYLDEDMAENQSLLAVADVDASEGNEHHLQAALATKAVFIPTPGTAQNVENYEKLYPPGKWTDPVSYLCTTQTVEEACSGALLDHDCTYYMDEGDSIWLDKNNQEARGEGTSAQGAKSAARKGKEKEPEIGVPVSITEDEFELVMGIFEKISDFKLEGDAPDFSSYRDFFLKTLPADMFASYAVPSWVPAPALLLRIARTIHPHWKQRRFKVGGRRIRPTLNYDEGDFLNESYVCFRRRDNKPIRKTRAAQLAHSADKLVQLRSDLSQVQDLLTLLHKRELLKKESAVASQRVWTGRQALTDAVRSSPGLSSKADDPLLVDPRPKKLKTPRTSLPKVKVIPPTEPRLPAIAAPPPPACITPAERCAGIQNLIVKQMSRDLEKNCGQLDCVDDPFQSPLRTRAAKMWVEMPPPAVDGQSSRRAPCALRMRRGRGGLTFLDRRSSHVSPLPLLSHRQHADEDYDEENRERLRAQWRFDDDDDQPMFGPPEEEGRELVDEFDSKYLMARTKWITTDEVTLVTDANIVVQNAEGMLERVLPFRLGDDHKKTILFEDARRKAAPASQPSSPQVSPHSTPSQQKNASQLHSRSPLGGNDVMRPPPIPGPPSMQENISPPPGGASPSTLAHLFSPNAYSPTRPPARSHTSAQPHHSNPLVPTAAEHVKPVSPGTNHALPTHPLQTNGARTPFPAYVPLSAGTNISLKLPPRPVARSSPLAGPAHTNGS
ncbi:hypothetical protein C8J57DRAFT_1501694 [Mycena rebaudengoi]|nr:hypothetical protein C8J57DRAFT_1501694 [Mycena rebaudengoi]